MSSYQLALTEAKINEYKRLRAAAESRAIKIKRSDPKQWHGLLKVIAGYDDLINLLSHRLASDRIAQLKGECFK